MKLLKSKPVRKNITLDNYLSDQLDKLSQISGQPQRMIIERALNHWSVRIHLAFTDEEHPLAESCDAYISSHVNNIAPEYFALYLKCFRYWLARTSFETLGDHPSSANNYIMNHIPVHLQEKYPMLGTIASMANQDTFMTSDATDNMSNVKLYIDTLMGLQDNPDVYKEDYLLRNLVVLFRDFAHPILPGMQEAQYAYFFREQEKSGLI